MKRLGEYLFLWVVGGMLYYSFEFIFRGFSHWSMFVLGGVCLVFCAWQGQILEWKDPFFRQILRCIIFVTACEFITGIIVNKWMKWHVWDYTGLPFQLWGPVRRRDPAGRISFMGCVWREKTAFFPVLTLGKNMLY